MHPGVKQMLSALDGGCVTVDMIGCNRAVAPKDSAVVT